jgi:hypothetical protein
MRSDLEAQGGARRRDAGSRYREECLSEPPEVGVVP